MSEAIVDRRVEGDCASPEYAEHTTPLGIVVVLSLLLGFAALYVLSYLVADWSRGTPWSVALGSAESFFYTVLGLVSIALIFRYRSKISTYEIVLAIMTATIVFIAMETRYWLQDLELVPPNNEIYFMAIVTLLIVLGALAMLKSERVLHVRIAEEDFGEMIKSFLIGWAAGVPLALINLGYIVLIEGLPWTIQDILNSMVMAAGVSVAEGVACRLMIMGLLLLALRRYLPKRSAVVVAVFAGAFTAPALYNSALLLTDPLVAAGLILATGIIFGLPMALMAYYRDIEAAIGIHWIVFFGECLLGY